MSIDCIVPRCECRRVLLVRHCLMHDRKAGICFDCLRVLRIEDFPGSPMVCLEEPRLGPALQCICPRGPLGIMEVDPDPRGVYVSTPRVERDRPPLTLVHSAFGRAKRKKRRREARRGSK